jgi:DNA polymerase I-like protein with 3'-5' exonuclease and polymerase domains
MIQVATDEQSFAIDVRDYSKKELREFFSFLEDPYYKKIGQNLKFDYQMLKAHYNVDLCNIGDTMIIDQLLYLGKNIGFSLEKLAKRYLGISYSSSNQLDLFTPVINNKISKETRKQFKLIGNKPFTSDQILYGLMDAEYTLQIYFHQLAKVAEEELFRAVTFECSFIPVLANMELAGFYLDNGM